MTDFKNKYTFKTYQKNISYWLSVNFSQSKQYIFKYTLYQKMISNVDLFLIYFMVSYSLQQLNHMAQRIHDILPSLFLIRKTFDFWSLLFLVSLACNHEKLLFQKWLEFVLYWINWSSYHFFLSLQWQ